MSDWPTGGCPDCNGLEVDCARCNGTGYLPEPDDEMPKWLTLDPASYRGGGVMSRRRKRSPDA